MTNLSGANLNNGAAVSPQGEGMDSPSSFPAYPAYKDSGVEWLGEVPEHWEVGGFRRLIKSVGNGTTADQVDEADDTVAVSRIETISTGQINFEKAGHVAPQDVAKRFLLNVGDILFSHINSLSMVGNVAIYLGGRPLLHGMNLLRIQPLSSVSSEWVLYWLKSKNIRQEVESRAKPAINQASISTDSVRALPALIPPRAEQTQIARFLDHETARIDALIEEQQRLIELLKEKRQAVISHAVTKGIDPTAPMKDSGVEWLGEVPAHWDVVALKRIVEVKDGTHATPSYVDPSPDAFPLITSKDFIGTAIDFDNCKYISREDHTEIMRRSDTQSGDVLMSMIGGNIGKALIVETSRELSIKNVALFKSAGNGKKAKQIMFFLESRLFEQQTELVSRGGAQGFLGLGDIRSLLIPKPPEGELSEILRYLAAQVPKLDSLINVAGEAIQLMNERRSALISAAVTGKVDVRGWQPPARAQSPELEQEAV